MATFEKTFLQEEREEIVRSTGAQVHLAVFGKHPGWDDHMDDIGLTTPSLLQLKSLLYFEGIAGQIDSGAWESLDEDKRIAEFAHVFVWQGPRGLLLGRLWSSQDGRGRSAYPMVTCCHFLTSKLPPNLDALLKPLEDFEQACKRSESAEGVIAAQRTTLEEITALCRSPVVKESSSDPQDRLAFLDAESMAPGREGHFRVLHALRSQCASYAPGHFRRRSSEASPLPQQLRVPACLEPAGKSARWWHQWLRPHLDSRASLLIRRHLSEDWQDIILGLPGPAEWLGLRANTKEIPLTNEIPFTIPDENRARFQTILSGFASGAQKVPSIWHDSDHETEEEDSFFGKLLRSLSKKKS